LNEENELQVEIQMAAAIWQQQERKKETRAQKISLME
jgi:hypothetical protein